VRAESMDEFHAAYAGRGLARSALASSYAMAETVFALTQSRPGTAVNSLTVDRERLLGAGDVIPVGADHPHAWRLASSGPCLPGSEVRVLGRDGEPLPPGRVGELRARSDALFSGYY